MRVREIHTKEHLSIPQLVELIGISRRTLQEIEKRGDCLVSNAIKIADALGVTLDELCRENPEQTETE